MRNLIFFSLLLIWSCSKTESFVPETEIPGFQEKALFTTYSELMNTHLVDVPWGDGFGFLNTLSGEWQVLEVIDVEEDGDIIHHDYSFSNLVYIFAQDCRYVADEEFVCSFKSNNPLDPDGFYGIKSEDDVESLFVKSSLLPNQTERVFANEWGKLFFWPGSHQILVVYNEISNFWIFLEKQI